MIQFRTEKVTDRITRIYAVCTELCYLVEGDERAALIDTGSGFGSLRTVVNQLTDKPLIILLTHGHTDHAMGSGEFTDCEVYLNHDDEYVYGPHGDAAFRYDGMKLAGKGVTITEEDYIPTAPFSLYRDMKGGEHFDLGGETVEIYSLPGHTKGSIVILMKNARILLLGDACNGFTFLYDAYSLSVAHYEENLKRVKKELDGKYDRILASHGDGELPLDILESCIQLCEDIKAGRTDDLPMEFRGDQGLIAKASGPNGRQDGGSGNIVYSREQIWRDGSLC
ncbi:MAG: MBL fold metallo-hydrolase [Oscillospiraceae bacterium]|nr:MBL fold metallo-hydrolase [Oscillospiraceae bacterium]